MTGIAEKLADLVGPKGVIGPEALRERPTSYWDQAPTEARCMVRPGSAEQLSALMRTCYENNQAVVVQGGLTGLVEGAVATAEDVIISLERMNRVESVDPWDGIAVVQAGAVLQTVQEHVAEQGFLFPLDFGARGSATIGGAVATNAGGLNVLRYGMMRNLVLGLEAVLADGTVVSSMNQMLKNNTGYDLKQLFIGSEGTLGIVTRAVIRLYPQTTSRQTALLAVENFESVVSLLQRMRAGLGGTLNAFEVMWNDYYQSVTGDSGHDAPLPRDYPYYVLAEAEGVSAGADEDRFTAQLEAGLEAGEIADAIIPKSAAERDAVWKIREEFDSALPAYIYDVSLPIDAMPTYVDRLKRGVNNWRDDASCDVFGHLADGNLHIFVRPSDSDGHREAADRIVYESLEGLRGSISAEHGIGTEKLPWLGMSRSNAEMALMRTLKQALDPKNLLNPGKVVG
ncbi:MAG: FAD-binding oxidoreductase [Woeseiaceae bacterium]|nr:FAD-binding oxidoreductase [Woeseiaceae bacterium]